MPRNKKEKLGSVKTDPLFTSDDFRMYCFKVSNDETTKKLHSTVATAATNRRATEGTVAKTEVSIECPYAHPGEKATRRDPRLYSYVGIECPHVKGESTKCPRGDMCPFAHNVFECWLHPSRYRTQMCNEPATCRRKICFFAHSMEEMREPTPVSKDINISAKGPRRVAPVETAKTDKKPPTTPRVHLKAAQSEPKTTPSTSRARASFDCAKRQPAVDLPPRPSLDSSASRLGLQSSSLPQVQSQTEAQNSQLLSLIALLQQQQQQQQQLQMKADSFDLATALSQLSLAGAQQQQQPCLQQSPYNPSPLAVGDGQSDQLNELLRLHLQQQLLQQSGNNMAMNQQPSFPLGVQNPQMNLMGLPAVSDSFLLQQQLQSLQALGPTAALRSSLDSNLSNSSGRIPARVSFDNVTSAAPNILQQARLNYMGTGALQQGLFGGMSPPVPPSELLFSQNPPRSSTESSVTESFGCLSGDSLAAEPLKQHCPLEMPSGISGQADDFISINQGTESFGTSNAVPSTAESFQP